MKYYTLICSISLHHRL